MLSASTSSSYPYPYSSSLLLTSQSLLPEEKRPLNAEEEDATEGFRDLLCEQEELRENELREDEIREDELREDEDETEEQHAEAGVDGGCIL